MEPTIDDVLRDPGLFRRLRNPPAFVSIVAVKKDPMLLRYVKCQTPEICVAAVRKSKAASILHSAVSLNIINSICHPDSYLFHIHASLAYHNTYGHS